MEDSLIRWGIIGCGNVTEVKSGPAYNLTDGFKIVAVMRRDAEKAKDYARRHGVEKYYSDADQLINDPDVDAVYIATPPDSHKEYALKVAAAGKPCCIEKPMAPSYSDCVEIETVFAEKNLPLFVAYYRRTLPRFLHIKSLIDNGTIGDIRHVQWSYSRFPSDLDLSGEYNWRTDTSIARGGYFDDLASHGLDLFLYIFGDIKDATGFSVNQQNLYTSKDAVTGNWIHESGVTGTAYWNFGSDRFNDKVEVIGSKGRIEFSMFGNMPITLSVGDDITEIDIEHPKHIQQYHVEKMRDALLYGKEHVSTGLTASRTAWVMDKILGVI